MPRVRQTRKGLNPPHKPHAGPAPDDPTRHPPHPPHKPHPDNSGYMSARDPGKTSVTHHNYVTHEHAAPTDVHGPNAVIARIIALCNGLERNVHREKVLSVAISRLIEQGRVRGLGKITQGVIDEVNRFSHVDDHPVRDDRYWA